MTDLQFAKLLEKLDRIIALLERIVAERECCTVDPDDECCTVTGG